MSCFKFPPPILWDCFSPCSSDSPYYGLTPKKSLHKNTRTTPSYALKRSFSTFFFSSFTFLHPTLQGIVQY